MLDEQKSKRIFIESPLLDVNQVAAFLFSLRPERPQRVVASRYVARAKLTSRDRQNTKKAYENGSATEFASLYEWDPSVVRSSLIDSIGPFVEAFDDTNKDKKKSWILLVGCGTGRDFMELWKRGFNALAFDISMAMIENLKRILTNSLVPPHNVALMLNEVARDLNQVVFVADVMDPSWRRNSSVASGEVDLFDAVFAETVLGHLDKEEVFEFFERYSNNLSQGGIIRAGLRISKSGKVFILEDSLGSRSFTTWKFEDLWLTTLTRKGTQITDYDHMGELGELLKYLAEIGLRIIKIYTNKHPCSTEENPRPDTLNLILQKVTR